MYRVDRRVGRGGDSVGRWRCGRSNNNELVLTVKFGFIFFWGWPITTEKSAPARAPRHTILLAKWRAYLPQQLQCRGLCRPLVQLNNATEHHPKKRGRETNTASESNSTNKTKHK
jgi:hypothetical protein